MQNIKSYYMASDFIMLNSSLERTPNVLIESMACGFSSVVRKIDEVDYYVTDTDSNLLQRVTGE